MTARKKAVKSKAELYRNMSAIRAADTKAEVILRSALHRRGLRFRKNVTSLPGRPDIVCASRRLIVFVDGDFWHARDFRRYGEAWIIRAIHERARTYWRTKFERRVERDAEVTRMLRKEGWTVVRLWESEVRADLVRVVDRVVRASAKGVAESTDRRSQRRFRRS